MRGADSMKVFKSGNTIIEVYSSLVDMEEDEREKYIKEEIEKENPKFMRIIEAIHNCYENED
jgi:hypothetical protein